MKIIFTLISLAFSLYSTCQTNEEIQDWEKNNPGKFLMSSLSYSYVDDDLKNKISSRVVFYEDINNSNIQKSATHSNNREEAHFDAREIKNWLANHQDVKILKRSEYDSFDSDLQTMYFNHLSLILIGETITVQDTRNYPY